MQANKDNFYFRHTKGDAVSERAVKMVDPTFDKMCPICYKYYGKKDGKAKLMDQDSMYYLTEVTPAEAIRLMEGGEVETFKIGDNVKWRMCGYFFNGEIKAIHKLTAWVMDSIGEFHSVRFDELQLDEPAPPTAEQELREILGGVIFLDSCDATVKMILSWHTKHQPKEVEIFDDEIISTMDELERRKNTNSTQDEIDLVRWALARAKGNNTNNDK